MSGLRKKLIPYALMLAFLLVPAAAAAADSVMTITVQSDVMNLQVNGSPVYKTNFLYQNTTYVPIRAVSEMLGATVTWRAEGNVANIIDKKYNNMIIDTRFKDIFAKMTDISTRLKSISEDIMEFTMQAYSTRNAQSVATFQPLIMQKADDLKAEYEALKLKYASINSAGYTVWISLTEYQKLTGYLDTAFLSLQTSLNMLDRFSAVGLMTKADYISFMHNFTLAVNRSQKSQYLADYYFRKIIARSAGEFIPVPNEPAGVPVVPDAT